MLIDVTKNETTGKYEVETDVKPTPGQFFPPMVSSQTNHIKYTETVTVTFPPTDINDVSVIIVRGEGSENITDICFKCSPDKYAGFDFERNHYNDWDEIQINLGNDTYILDSALAYNVYNDPGSYALIPKQQ